MCDPFRHHGAASIDIATDDAAADQHQHLCTDSSCLVDSTAVFFIALALLRGPRCREKPAAAYARHSYAGFAKMVHGFMNPDLRNFIPPQRDEPVRRRMHRAIR